MNRLAGLLAQDISPRETVKRVVSERFVDHQNNPVAWEIRGISRRENRALMSQAMRWIPLGEDGGLGELRLDEDTYALDLAVACTVFPDLKHKELLSSYEVDSPAELLKAMLLPGELDAYCKLVQNLTGFGPGYQSALENRMEKLLAAGDHDAVVACQCMTEFYWPPGFVMALSMEERALIYAGLQALQKERAERERLRKKR